GVRRKDVATLSAQTYVALMMTWMLMARMHKADQTAIKDTLRKMLAEGTAKIDLSSSGYTAEEQQTYRDKFSHAIQWLLAVEPDPEDLAAGLDRIFPTLWRGIR